MIDHSTWQRVRAALVAAGFDPDGPSFAEPRTQAAAADVLVAEGMNPEMARGFVKGFVG